MKKRVAGRGNYCGGGDVQETRGKRNVSGRFSGRQPVTQKRKSIFEFYLPTWGVFLHLGLLKFEKKARVNFHFIAS